MIQARNITKHYGDKVAVDAISFTVAPGKVTGFLGPNGAGKSTTMRMIVGLDRPTAGTVTVNGRRYAEHGSPLTEVGVLLEAKAVHTGRSAEDHLRAVAATHGFGRRRVEQVIDMTGLHSVAGKRVGGFSLGMGQRLGLAVALLGDPHTLILDEPVNGLDPEGVLWVRNLLRQLAAEGRTVFLSSHLMSEMALTADHILVIGRGRIIADAPVADIIARSSGTTRDRPHPRTRPAGRPAARPRRHRHPRRRRLPRSPRHHRPGHRRGRRLRRPGPARAGAASRQPRGLVHVADRRRRRVPRHRQPLRRPDRSDRTGARHPAGTELEGDPPMSTQTALALSPAAVARAEAHRVTFPRVLHSEWIKFWSLRSTVWTVAATVIVMAAVSWLAAFFTAREATNPGTEAAGRRRADPPAARPRPHPDRHRARQARRGRPGCPHHHR